MKTRVAAIRTVRLRALPLVGLTFAFPAFALEGLESAGSASQLGVSIPAANSAPATGGRTGWFFVPSLSVSETLTDNVALAPSDRKQSEWITTISPAIRVDGVGARTRLNLTYRASAYYYANNSPNNNIQNSLDATGRVEAIEKWLFVEGSGHIAQSPLTSFGALPTTGENINNNRVETRTWQISPYVAGRFGTVADYQLRYRVTTTHTSQPDNTNLGTNIGANIDTREWSGVLRGTRSQAALNWALDATTSDVRGNGRRDISLSVIRGRLTYNVYPRELAFTLIGGYEENNYASPQTESKTIYGAGFEWTPSPRTQVSGLREQRFFGDAYNYSIRYRTPLTAWRLGSTRDVTVTPAALSSAGRGTAYDILFDSLTSRFPDPVLRAQETERQLRESGIPANQVTAGTVLTNRAYVLETRQASAVLNGVRNTVTFTASFSKSRTVESTPTATPDDFSLTPEVTSRALSVDWAHKLSAYTSLSVAATRTEASGISATPLETSQALYRILLSHQVTRKTYATLGARMQHFDSTVGNSFREKAVLGTISTSF